MCVACRLHSVKVSGTATLVGPSAWHALLENSVHRSRSTWSANGICHYECMCPATCTLVHAASLSAKLRDHQSYLSIERLATSDYLHPSKCQAELWIPAMGCSKAPAMQENALRCKSQHVQHFAPDFKISQPFITRFSNGLQHCNPWGPEADKLSIDKVFASRTGGGRAAMQVKLSSDTTLS